MALRYILYHDNCHFCQNYKYCEFRRGSRAGHICAFGMKCGGAAKVSAKALALRIEFCSQWKLSVDIK